MSELLTATVIGFPPGLQPPARDLGWLRETGADSTSSIRDPPRATSRTGLDELLNDLFSDFDKLAKRHKVEKIKTIGDAYMAAGGLPEENPDHALSVAEMALGMIERETGKRFDLPLKARIGLRGGGRGPHRSTPVDL
jgi:class 3 adenylate cyclase